MGSSTKTRLAKLEKRIVPRPLSFRDVAMIAWGKGREKRLEIAAWLGLPPIAADFAFTIELSHDPAPDPAFPFSNWETEEIQGLLELLDYADKHP